MKYLNILILTLVLCVSSSFANDRYLDSLRDINPDLKKYFPRWKVAEPDLQFRIYQSFVQLGFDKDSLDKQSIIVLAAPRKVNSGDEYDILLLSCGKKSMNAQMLDREIPQIVDFLSGKKPYRTTTFDHSRGTRDYAYEDIPIEVPIEEDQGVIMVDYLNQPKGVNQAMILSLYEQNLKIGTTGFWLKSEIGNDRVGYPFWTAGESSVNMEYDLYLNNDSETNVRNPELLKIRLGGTYRINGGLNTDEESILSILPDRRLNSHPNGKINFGLDYSFPFHPQAGLSLNFSTPLQRFETEGIDDTNYFQYSGQSSSEYVDDFEVPGFDVFAQDPREGNIVPINNGGELFTIVPVLETTGQLTAFYNLWIDEEKAENFFRFELGASYSEIREYLRYRVNTPGAAGNVFSDEITTLNTNGVGLVHPDELADWVFAKIEYRNQAVYPFSASIQYSNQILLTRAFVKLFGNWLFLEAKYATPLRDALPYELENFFMISPVLRITI